MAAKALGQVCDRLNVVGTRRGDQRHGMVTDHGGSISAEHGIGQDKLKTLQETRDPVAMNVMRAVKQALDPGGLLNPGKLVGPKG